MPGLAPCSITALGTTNLGVSAGCAPLKTRVGSSKLGYGEQTLPDGSGPRKWGQVDAKARNANEVAAQRQIGDAQCLAVSACGARCELRFVSAQTLVKPVRRPVARGRLVRSELFGQLGLHARHHKGKRVCGR